MFKRVFGIMGKLINKQELDLPLACLATGGEPQQTCQSHPQDPQDLAEIERLQSELVAFELELGRLIVEKERRWGKVVLKQYQNVICRQQRLKRIKNGLWRVSV